MGSRILFIVPSLKVGGMERVLVTYANALASRGYNVTVMNFTGDVVIIGSAPDVFIEERLKADKLTFRYAERYFKEGKWRILDPRVLYSHYKLDMRYRSKPLYMLCASAYTAPDCRFIHSYIGKTYKWGYFTEVKKYQDIDALIRLKRPASILWVGRLIGWKHPDASIHTATQLKAAGYSFHLDIIGDGELRPKLQKMIEVNGLQNEVTLLGFMPPEKVREHMEQAEIFMFTSDRNEGWGVVLNESMNSACAVVACREIGSVPYLIKDNENGLIYDQKGKQTLFDKVKLLMDDPDLRMKLQKNAYHTMKEVWNADTAAERLLKLIENLQKGKETDFLSGPCRRD